MILERLIDDLAETLRARVLAEFGQAVERVTLEIPPRLAMGDLATPIAMELARVVRRPPRAIAEKLVEGLSLPSVVTSVSVEGAGYVNFRIDRGLFTSEHLRRVMELPLPAGDRVLVEHTNINPNKAAHIGHLRNAVLGDTLVRSLRWLGYRVETQNYIDDTGVQVADVVVGFEKLLGEGKGDVQKRIATEDPPFDYFCWDLYSRVARHYEENPDAKALELETLHKIEKQEGDTAELAATVAEAIVRRHLRTMLRLGIQYDVLTAESDIIRLHFWERAFDLLKESGSVVHETEGKHAGCWVMKLRDSAEFEGLEEPDKILVRSNGTVTYVGKDIAYQLWKFGLIDRTFGYREFSRYPEGLVLWHTASDGGDPSAPKFGRADRVYNVIDNRQSYLQKIVREGLRLLGHGSAADNSIHFSYEMVALSRETAEALGMAREGEEKRVLEMSGRKGLGVKADDLLDELERKAGEAVRDGLKSSDLGEDDRRALAHDIAVGALRYFMLKFGRNKVIAFDFKEALAFEGDTGPYLQYSVVRAENIFRKMAERDVSAGLDDAGIDRLSLGGTIDDDLWEIIRMSAETGAVVRRAVETLELSMLANHAFALCQKFNSFYHKYPILNEADPDVRRQRAACADAFRQTMRGLMALMGIPVPERM